MIEEMKGNACNVNFVRCVRCKYIYSCLVRILLIFLSFNFLCNNNTVNDFLIDFGINR